MSDVVYVIHKSALKDAEWHQINIALGGPSMKAQGLMGELLKAATRYVYPDACENMVKELGSLCTHALELRVNGVSEIILK